MKALLLGAGRMGMRHLAGLRAAGAEVDVVDPRAECREEAAAAGATPHESLAAALAAVRFDAAVFGETAAGRLERVEQVTAAGVPALLLEKPLEQSRARTRRLAEVTAVHGADVRVNHYFRTLDLFRELRSAGGPFRIALVGGAFGLACNGIHWIDLALYLAGGAPGRLVAGELDNVRVASGRGAEFCDYGGQGLFAFADGSRLFVSSATESSAPMQATIVQPSRETVLLPHQGRAVLAVRDPSVDKLPYLYGAGYEWRERPALTGEELIGSTTAWARAVAAGEAPRHATVEQSVAAHDLLFDLLETGGDTTFAVT